MPNRLGTANLYGSARLGAQHPEALVYPRLPNQLPTDLSAGSKRYELTNHLGNVLSTVSDLLTPVDTDNNNTTDHFAAIVHNQQAYYPFGMLMPGLQYTPPGERNTRYGFGGHEKVDAVLGNGNTLDMGDRWLEVRLSRTPKLDAHANKYPSLSPYSYAANSPLIFLDPDGRDIVLVHGTWSSTATFKDLKGIKTASKNLFGDDKFGRAYSWSGANYSESRTEAALGLINHVRTQMQSKTFNGEITLIGHSHGGNVAIEALNMMAEMEEFKNIKFNLLTINTPIRPDYQLSKNAKERVNHANVYDPKDPVQSRGGNSLVILPDLPRTPDFMDIDTKFTGEYGPAGRTFNPANCYNIEVDNPQGIIEGHMMGAYIGDYHNSHNRVNDWIHKTEKK